MLRLSNPYLQHFTMPQRVIVFNAYIGAAAEASYSPSRRVCSVRTSYVSRPRRTAFDQLGSYN